jgi:phospholipid-translocating ATPase
LYNEFSFFFNMYFLLVALSQIIPALRIGYLSTYIAPLAFVLAITLGKEALDDIARRKRDNEANAEGFTVLQFDDPSLGPSKSYASNSKSHPANKSQEQKRHTIRGAGSALAGEDDNGDDEASPRAAAVVRERIKKSRDLKVGDVLKLGKDQRVPADVVILKSYPSESTKAVDAEDITDIQSASPTNLINTSPETEIATTTMQSTIQSTLTSPGPDAAPLDTDGVGETFIRTDQLDGETDWKLRLASSLTQSLDVADFVRLRVIAGKPDRKVNEFVGTVQLLPTVDVLYDAHLGKGKAKSSPSSEQLDGDTSSGINDTKSAPLTVDNTAWANTVLASNSTTLAVVVYTGSQTRQALSTSPSRSKTGLLEYEINALTKILCALTLALSIILVALEGFESTKEAWYVAILRFLILFSTIIPISLRVNLDLGKSVYARFIERDQGIKGAVVRTSTIPEDLGRVEYLLSDKTGTLTQNGKLNPIWRICTPLTLC